jgi:hypothetical protein
MRESVDSPQQSLAAGGDERMHVLTDEMLSVIWSPRHEPDWNAVYLRALQELCRFSPR